MPRRKLLLGFVIILSAYVATWIGGSISTNEDLVRKAQLAYQEAERKNKEQVEEARRLGTDPGFLIPLHEGGPIVSEGCLPLLPGVLLRHWESSIGPGGGGGGNSLVLYYLFGSKKIYSFGGWRN